MDHATILKRAWHMVWRYRALWIFGIILALTTSSWEASTLWRDDSGRRDQGVSITLPEDWSEELDDQIRREVEELNELFRGLDRPELEARLIAIGIGVLVVVFVLVVLGLIGRYLGSTALIRMVNEYEDTGERCSVRQGFRMGWSRSAWRLFLMDLVLDLPTVFAFLILFAVALSPLLLWTGRNETLGAIGTVAAIGLFFMVVFAAIVVGAALSLLKRFFRRECVLGELGVGESIRRGYALVRANVKDVGLMWLISVGISLAYAILTIPIGLLLAGVGALAGGGAGLVIGRLATAAFGAMWGWFAGGAVGVPIFLLIVTVPLGFVGGLREVFRSSTWTLTYRELSAIDKLKNGEQPGPEA
jgi:hypothetical protein